MTTHATTNDAQYCPACGAANHCAIAEGAASCWCMAEPVGAPLPATNTASCYCRKCLHALPAQEDSAQLHKPDISR